MRSLLLNQRGTRFTIWQMIAFGIVCALIGMVVSGYASFQKTGQGFVGTPAYNDGTAGVPTDYWQILSGTWDNNYGCATPVTAYLPCLSTITSGEVKYNSELVTLPSNGIIQFWYGGSTIDATDDIIDVKFRMQLGDEGDYYQLRIHWDSDASTGCTSGTCVELQKSVDGSLSDLVTDSTWTPATNTRYQFVIVLDGSVISVYKHEIVTGSGDADIRQFVNQSDFVKFTSPILTVTDTTYSSGDIRIKSAITSTTLTISAFRIVSGTNISVNNVGGSQYAMFCQAPEILQSWVSNVADSTEGQIHDNNDGSFKVKMGMSFKFRENVNIENVNLYLRKVGSPTGQLVVKIYDNDGAGGNPGTVLATSDSINVGTYTPSGGTSPFTYPDEYEFTFTTANYPSINQCTNADCYFILESGTTAYTTTTNDYMAVWLTTSGSQIYGTRWMYESSWTSDANDLTFKVQAREIMRAVSSAIGSGTITIASNSVAYWQPMDGHIKIATSNTDCYTSIVDASPISMINASGDTWTYNSGMKLTIGPELGCPDDSGSFPVWIRGSDYVGGTQYAAIQYSTGTLLSVDSCTGACTESATISLTGTTDWTGSITISPSSNTQYNYRVIFCDGSTCQNGQRVIQTSSTKTFTTPPTTSTEINSSFCAASCFNINQMPFTHLSNITSENCKVFWSLGDNIYTDVPWDLPNATFKEDYWMRHRDTLIETNYANIYGSVFQCKQFDDHEWKNDAYGNTGTMEAQSTERYASHFYSASKSGITDYVSNLRTSSSNIRSGRDYFTSRWGKSAYVVLDEIFEKDSAGDNDIGYYYGHGLPTNPTSNPNWESGTTSWTCQAGDASACDIFETITTPVQNGSNALRIRENAAGYAIAQQAITVVANTVYKFRVYYQQSAVTTAGYFRIRTDSYTGGSDICSAQGPTTANVWTALDCTIPDSNSDTSVYLQMVSNAAGGIMSYFDNLTMEVGPPSGSEVQPSCTRNAGNAKLLDCTSTTFTTENPAISTTKGIVEFQNRMYSINAVNSNTQLQTVEDMLTGTDAATRIWKTGKEMISRQQMVDIANKLGVYDDDSNVDIIFIMTSKPLNTVSNSWPAANTLHDDWGASYTAQRDFLMGFSYNNMTTKPLFISGDRHKFSITKHTNINASGQWEFLVGNGGAPNDFDIQTVKASDIQEEFVLRKGMGIVTVNTSASPVQSFAIKDSKGNRIYHDNGNIEEVSSRKSVHTVLDYQHTYKIQRGTDGYCYALYYNGSAFKLAISDTNCQNFSDNALDVSALSFDNDGQSPSMWWNDDGTTKKLIFYYVKSAKTQAYMRTATLTSGSPAWNADETSWFGNDTGNYATNLQIVTDSTNYVWGMATVWISSTQDGVRLKRATCGTNCVTSPSGNALTDAVTANIDMMTIAPITNSDVVIIWEESNDIYYAECDQTTPSCTPGRTLLNSINTSGENIINSALGGWQPQLAHDGSGGVGILYRNPVYPYSVQFKKYDSSTNSWGSAITIGNTNNKNQTSPTIAKVGNQFIIGWLEGILTTLKLYRSILNPTVVGDFISLNIVPDDGWIKTRLSLSQSQVGSPAILYWQRVFGVNKGGFGQPIQFSQAISTSTINPFLLYEKLWHEVNP